MQAGGEARISTRGREDGEERRQEEVEVHSCSEDAETDSETDWGVSDGKHGTGSWRPTKLQDSRPRAPPAVWRNATQGFPFASAAGGKKGLYRPSLIPGGLFFLNFSHLFLFFNLFVVSLTHTLLACATA